MACAYGKDGEKCFIGNNTLTADEGQGGSAGPSSKLKSNEVIYMGKLIFSTGLKHQKSKRLFCGRTITTWRSFPGRYLESINRRVSVGVFSLGSAFGWDYVGSPS